MVTKNGIYLDLKESKFECVRNGLIFYFSSENYLDKYLENVSNYIKEESIKLKNKYLVECDFDKFLAISYYKKVEKRGFYVLDRFNNEVAENVKLNCTIN